MAKEYLEKLNRLMEKLTVECPENTSLELKHFFSGAAASINNRIFLTLTPAGLALKVPEEMKTLLFSKYGAEPLQYFSKAPVKRDYALFQDITTLDSRDLKMWIRSSAEYALSFPEKYRRKRSIDTLSLPVSFCEITARTVEAVQTQSLESRYEKYFSQTNL